MQAPTSVALVRSKISIAHGVPSTAMLEVASRIVVEP
jgi:hypothetical protein